MIVPATAVSNGNIITGSDIITAKDSLFPGLLDVLINSPEALGLNSVKVENAVLCNGFSIAVLSGSTLDKTDNIKYFPIVANDEIIALITLSEIEVTICNDHPACMLSYYVNNDQNRHATSLCGYYISGTVFEIRLMDSAYECYKFSTYSATNGFRFAFGNTQYQWDATIKFQ